MKSNASATSTRNTTISKLIDMPGGTVDQEFSMTMPSMMLATSSQRSVTASSSS